MADGRTHGTGGHGTTGSLFRVASRVVYRTPAAMLNEYSFLNQLFDGVFHRGLADGGAKRHKIGLGELANLLHAGPADNLQRRQLLRNHIDPVLEIPVRCKKNPNHVLDEWGRVFHILMPASPAFFQSVIIELFISRDLSFQRDVLCPPYNLCGTAEAS